MCALAAGHVWWSLRPALLEIRNDFANYYAPARALVDGRPLARLYERDAFQREVERAGLAGIGSFVPHPPPNALLLAPFAKLHPAAAKAAWTLLLALAYAATLPVLRALSGLPTAQVALLLLLPTASLKNALAYGQPYPLLLLLLSLSLAGIAGGRKLLGGAALAPALLLKLYAAPHALFLLARGRWRALAGALVGSLLLLVLSVGALGFELHDTYVREVLPPSLRGEIQDPYSPLWGSLSSLAHRLFQGEPDLNPAPALEAPGLVAPVARGLEAFLLLLALAARPEGDPSFALRRQWAALTLAALSASPLTQSYHFVLLPLPLALLLGERPSRGRAAWMLALFAFATSPLPHYFAGFAHGWANLFAYPRLLALVALLLLALHGCLSHARVALCLAVSVAVGALQPAPPPEPGWSRITSARGYLQAAPIACGGRIGWITTLGDGFAYVDDAGAERRVPASSLSPRCASGAVRFEADDDSDRDARGTILVDASGGALFADDGSGVERPLATGRFRRPRLSPDGRQLLAESWEDGSWEIRVIEREGGASRRLTNQPSNEIEPAWTEDGTAVLFASDRRRGLGSTALYRLELR